MPVPGPRTQERPLPGYTNPGHETPTRWQFWLRPGPIMQAGRSPGLQMISRRGNVLGAGQIRSLWRQAINFTPAQAPYSWATGSPSPGRPGRGAYPGLGITRALRYMTRSTYAGAGIDSSRYAGLHTRVAPRARMKPVTLPAGGRRGVPTVRNRLTSFGSRVPVLNQSSSAAEGQ